VIAIVLSALLLAAPPAGPAPATPEEARAFVARVNAELKRLWLKANTAEWVRMTHITDDTDRLAAWASEDMMAYMSSAISESLRFDRVAADPDTRRMLTLLRVRADYVDYPPAPRDPAKRAELAGLSSRLGSIYGKGKWCGPKTGTCRDLEELSQTMAKSRSHDELLDAWVGWHAIAVEMRPLYQRFVALSNEGAREIGFSDLGEQWRSGYDMPPEAFAAEIDRLWQQLRPLYQGLHCYVRARLAQAYGEGKVPPRGPIPAHLLGNMWAQSWENVYQLVEPYPGQASLDLETPLKTQGYDAVRLMKLGEAFFTSLGLGALPKTFWERSMLEKPRDREVVCHPSAWDLDGADDLRIKMCIRVNEEDLFTVHHELGHNYYQRAYAGQPFLFQTGANDGFHEAIGDALTLSITPAYLKKLGLASAVAADEKGLVNLQMKDALEKIAFLPFGLLVDRWRWEVFSGKVKPAAYNASWWELRRKYQGVAAPLPRSEEDFDPGAKYHVPANVAYTRYFMARILQFQFHRAMCRIAGHQGPLHACSIYGNQEVGKRLGAMLALGASRPWPDALEALAGERRMDASALSDYFAPLKKWLDRENEGRTCGW
jgi:peptidyl-dipeptidase A